MDAMAEKNNAIPGYSYAVNNPVLFTDPFGLDASSANANKLVYEGDVIVFENGSSAVQSVNEATVKGQKANSQSADLTLLSPGSFSLVFV